MNACCSRLAEIIDKNWSPIRNDDHGVTFLIRGIDACTMETVISCCPFCGTDISVKNTHRVQDVLAADCEFRIHFANGSEVVVKDCSPVDFSIYHQTGGWSGTIVDFEGTEAQINLFKPGSGIDFYEDDIVSVQRNGTCDLLYQKQ